MYYVFNCDVSAPLPAAPNSSGEMSHQKSECAVLPAIRYEKIKEDKINFVAVSSL